jgi:hypothetical protein
MLNEEPDEVTMNAFLKYLPTPFHGIPLVVKSDAEISPFALKRADMDAGIFTDVKN